MTDLTQIFRLTEHIYPSKESLEEVLKSGRKLRIYFGIDPTGAKIHIGHAVPLRLLKSFQNLGHKVTLVVGDFTGAIGDPSGRDTRRPVLTSEQIVKNSNTYKNQVQKILSFSSNPPKITYNSTWWDKINSREFLEIVSHVTLAQLLERDLFQERLKKGNPISVSEFLYPLLQGYDSVALDADVEIGATDQTFNMLIGRELVKIYKTKEKLVITTPLLEGTDGRKMSKSFNNTVDIDNDPNDMYGKIMSINDNLIIKYLKLATDISDAEISKIESSIKKVELNPMEAKKKLAYEIVRIYNGNKIAKTAAIEFERVFQKGKRTSTVQTSVQSRSILPISYASLATISGATSSVSETVRLASSSGLKVDGRLVANPRELIKKISGNETIIDVGKRKSVKIIWK
ncbi:MAG: tyrosine--tRNA ligase [bacterium]|nr:tyrosine--tRNA ligase [bacterium]